MTQTTEQNQSPLIEVTIIDDAPHDSDGVRLVTIDELQEILNNRPINLLQKALEKNQMNQAKLRTLYRAQAFCEIENISRELGCADGSDCGFIEHIIDELKQVEALISKAIEQLETPKS